MRVNIEGHAAARRRRTSRPTVEEAIYEAAPDLTSLVDRRLEEPAAQASCRWRSYWERASAAR